MKKHIFFYLFFATVFYFIGVTFFSLLSQFIFFVLHKNGILISDSEIEVVNNIRIFAINLLALSQAWIFNYIFLKASEKKEGTIPVYYNIILTIWLILISVCFTLITFIYIV